MFNWEMYRAFGAGNRHIFVNFIRSFFKCFVNLVDRYEMVLALGVGNQLLQLFAGGTVAFGEVTGEIFVLDLPVVVDWTAGGLVEEVSSWFDLRCRRLELASSDIVVINV